MRFLSYHGIPLWRDVRVLRGVVQVISVIIVVSIVVFLINNLLGAADRRGIPLGFGFVDQAAGFPIGESVIDYEPSKPFLYAFFVGLLNTLKVALVGIVLATILGVIVGLARLSSNWLVSSIASVYIETFRNVPLLVQLFFWYFGVFLTLPQVQDSIHLPGPFPVYLSVRGVFMPQIGTSSSFGPWLLFVLGGIVLAVLLRVVLIRLQRRTGRSTHPLLASALALILVPALALFLIAALGWLLVGESPLTREVPVLGRFNFEGGSRLTLEFTALLVGLVVYTATFIAEIVRAGILAVQRGQVEAARAVGLNNLQALRLVIIPQALRIIIPPLISQYLNLTKNSSLAIAIGYPDLFQVGKIMVNQAGRAVPIFLMIMAAYLAMSLTYALIGNIYNRRVRLVER